MMRFFQPKIFVDKTQSWIVWSLIFMMLFLNVGYIWGLFFSPLENVQGLSVKILFIHVPAAWMALFSYASLGAFSLSYLSSKSMVAYYLARSCGVVGICFTAVCLISGSLWGLPTWGTWWVWDARLTSVLILFFLFLTYLLMGKSFPNQQKAYTFSSLIALVGLVNLPVIKWSVDWWSTLHQPASITKFSAPSMHWSFLIPLMICALGWFFFWTVTVLVNTHTILKKQRRNL